MVATFLYKAFHFWKLYEQVPLKLLDNFQLKVALQKIHKILSHCSLKMGLRVYIVSYIISYLYNLIMNIDFEIPTFHSCSSHKKLKSY